MIKRKIGKYLHSHSLDMAAVIISLIALYFAIWQGKEQIKHNHISVQPRLTSYFASDTRQQKFGIYIINNGMGSAFVTQLKVFVDGQEVPDHIWGKFYSAGIKLNLNPLCFVFGGPRPNDSFGVAQLIFLIEAKSDPFPLTPAQCAKDALTLHEASKNRLDYALTVESIYGDTFEYKYHINHQTKVK